MLARSGECLKLLPASLQTLNDFARQRGKVESGGGRVREGAYQFSVEMWRQYFLVSLGFVLVAVVAVVVAVRASVFVFLFRPHRIRMLPLSGKVSTDCSQRIQLAVIKRARGGLTLFRASQKTRRLHGRSPGASRCVHFPRLNINCRLASSFLPSRHFLLTFFLFERRPCRERMFMISLFKLAPTVPML